MELHYCCACKAGLQKKGVFLNAMWEVIGDAYYQTNRPVVILHSHEYFTIIKYLELHGFLTSTEFPDPYEPKKDALLVEPMAYLIEGLNGPTLMLCANHCFHFDN